LDACRPSEHDFQEVSPANRDNPVGLHRGRAPDRFADIALVAAAIVAATTAWTEPGDSLLAPGPLPAPYAWPDQAVVVLFASGAVALPPPGTRSTAAPTGPGWPTVVTGAATGDEAAVWVGVAGEGEGSGKGT